MTETLSVLERLVGFDTVSSNSNLELVDFVETYLESRGFDVARSPDPTGEKAGLFARIGPDGDGVMLSAHSDVVPVAGQLWSRDPFRLSIEDARAFGRGTTDMKGFLACMLACADRASRATLREPLKLAMSYDEEVGCIGIARMIDVLDAAIGRPRACIVGEPTEMKVAVGHKGKLALRATCHGQAGHSAMAPNHVNALFLATDFVGRIRAFQEDFARNGARDGAYAIPVSTLHVGRLQGGRALNIVPDRAEVTFELRHLVRDSPEAVLSRLRDAADQVATPYRAGFPEARVEIDTLFTYPGLDVPESAEVVGLVRAWAGNPAITKVSFGTEAGYFDGLGIPTVVCGPGSMDGQGHKADEFVELSQLEACDAMMDRLLAVLC